MSKIVIVVEYRSDVLGDGEFWRGPSDNVSEIHNIPARRAAEAVVKTGRPQTFGMWHVRQEES